jgi:isoleucyl-tRNA synthetase
MCGVAAVASGVARVRGTLDKLSAYQTLYTVLVTLTKLMAPIVPFFTEAMYQNLVRQHGFDEKNPSNPSPRGGEWSSPLRVSIIATIHIADRDRCVDEKYFRRRWMRITASHRLDSASACT